MFMYMCLYLLRFKVWGCGLQCWVPNPAVALPSQTLPSKNKVYFYCFGCVLCVITGWAVVSVFLNGRRVASWTHGSFSFCVSVYWDRKYWSTGCFCQLANKKNTCESLHIYADEELWRFNNCLILRECRCPHHNYNDTEEQYHGNLFQN